MPSPLASRDRQAPQAILFPGPLAGAQDASQLQKRIYDFALAVSPSEALVQVHIPRPSSASVEQTHCL